MKDCKHERWVLERCVKCSSTGGMRCCLFVPWNSFHLFLGPRGERFYPHTLPGPLAYPFLKSEPLNSPCLHSYIHAAHHWNSFSLLTQSSPTKYRVPETDRDRQQGRFGLSPQRSAAGEWLWEEGTWLHRSNSTEAGLGLSLLWSALS